MSDDYLWDPSGPPDPEIERLERALGRLGTTAPAPDFAAISQAAAGGARYVGSRFLGPALAAAAVIALMVGAPSQSTRTAASVHGARGNRHPRLGARGALDASR